MFTSVTVAIQTRLTMKRVTHIARPGLLVNIVPVSGQDAGEREPAVDFVGRIVDRVDVSRVASAAIPLLAFALSSLFSMSWNSPSPPVVSRPWPLAKC